MNRSFFIAGAQYHDLSKIIKDIKVGDFLDLVPEPTNEFDSNAVRVCYEDLEKPDPVFLGYVPRIFSAEVCGLLEAEVYLECIVTAVNPSSKPWEMCKVTIYEPLKEDRIDE